MMERLPMQSQNPTPEESTRLLYKNWRERLALPLLIGVLIFGAAALIPAIRASGNAIVNAIFITSYAMTALVTVVKFPYTVRMGVFITCIYVIGLGELFLHGILGDSLFFFLAVVIFATILLSPRIGISMIGINLLTLLLVGFLMLSRQFTPFNPFAAPAKVEDWLSAGAAILMFSAVIILGFQRLEQEFIQAQKQIDATLTSLKEERGNLEQKVLERTVLLKKVNEVGQSITAILDPDEVLSNAARHINDEFDCYYTAFYLVDSSGHWAELKEATGEAGKVLRENRYRLDLNGKNLVAKAVRERLGHIASEEDAQQARVDNPLLPYTRSQIVLPLVVGNKLLGALEMHATKEEHFTSADVDAFQNLANGVATALENARLFQEARQSLIEMRATQRQYLQNAWQSLSEETTALDYELGEADLKNSEEIEIPLSLREQFLGSIQLANTSEWTTEHRSLIEAIATQASLALENARLVEESQSVAARERIANEIISKIWASPNMDSILQTTARELGRALEASEVEIEVSMQDDSDE
jgi:GAF domain-containing protein